MLAGTQGILPDLVGIGSWPDRSSSIISSRNGLSLMIASIFPLIGIVLFVLFPKNTLAFSSRQLMTDKTTGSSIISPLSSFSAVSIKHNSIPSLFAFWYAVFEKPLRHTKMPLLALTSNNFEENEST